MGTRYQTSKMSLATLEFNLPEDDDDDMDADDMDAMVLALFKKTVPSGATLTITDANNDYNTTINTKSSAQNVYKHCTIYYHKNCLRYIRTGLHWESQTTLP